MNARRDFLSKASIAALGVGAAGCGMLQQAAAMESAKSAKQLGPTLLDPATTYKNNYWNRDAWARLISDLDFGKQRAGWWSGVVLGVYPGQKVKELCGFEGFSFSRLVDDGNGVYQKLLREVGFYTDLKTGEVLEEFTNPYTDEKVKVVHVANDPFNHHIGPFLPKGPSYGGLNKLEETPDIPLLLNWRETGDGKVALAMDIHLQYPSALQPDKWPRESSGSMVEVSEMFRYVIDIDDLADESKTAVDFTGTWNRITPWLPWMLMGQAPGHIVYTATMGNYPNLDVLSPKVRAYAENNGYEKYFSAPTEWVEPSFSSLENYAREQTPASVKK